jgi:transaldolase
MKIFIDSGDLNEIKEASAMGVIDGVTTHPSLVARTGKSLPALIATICEIIDGPISAAVSAVDAQGMLEQGRMLAKIHPNVVVEVPLVAEGIKAVKMFAQEGIKTNVTPCLSATQGLLAAKAGATYISPLVGAVDDIAGDGMELFEQLVTIYDNYDYETEVLAAGVRHPVHVVRAALVGAHASTIPLAVIQQLLAHPLTDSGLETFLANAEKTSTT